MDGSNLKAWRVGAGLTMPAAAEMLGISRATLARYEAGGPVPDKIVARLDDQLAQPGARPPTVAETRDKAVADRKPTLAEARAILEAAGLHVLTGAELAKLTQPAEGRAHTGPAFERPSPTRANTPGRTPPKDAILPPDERQPGMSKNAVVRKTIKKRRHVGFDAAGGEVWK